MRLRCSCRCEEAVTRLSWVAKIAVSSENVPIVVFLVVGRSYVERVYSIGLSKLPWGTPERIGRRSDISSFILTSKNLSLRYDLSRL
jgi:hypothetical protein